MTLKFIINKILILIEKIQKQKSLDDEERRNLMDYISAQSSIPLSSFKNIT